MAQVIGDTNNNWLIGTGGADSIFGLGGNDSLKGGGGADTLNGGDGVDTAVYAGSDQVWVDLQSGTGRLNHAEGDRLIGIENVYGSGGFDLLFGSNVANTLSGAAGGDWLDGRGGADVLEGGYGNDSLTGGSGGDVLNGGEDQDTAIYRESPAGVLVSLASGFATGGDAGGDTFISVEHLVGSEFGDFLLGDDGNNFLTGWGGSDSLKGFGGSDVLQGGEGHDTLQGMDGTDYLHGDPGNDQLIGGRGVDFMAGAGGADTFIWSSIDDTGTTAETGDFVEDFVPADGDRLDVSGVDADVFAADNQAFRFIGNAAFSGTPGEINYVHQNGQTIIQMQTGMSGDVEGVIGLPGIVTPEESWFVL
jgi:Ca2+-binding RTX toxin-like protein